MKINHKTGVSEDSSPIRGEVVEVKIADLIPGDNRELSEVKVEDLRRSIRRLGQIEPIVINGENRVIGGYHRYEAFKREGWETIRATRRTDLSPTDEVLVQMHENTMRAELTFSQKMACCKWIEENLAVSAGNPNLISAKWQKLEKEAPVHVSKLVIEHGIWNSERVYFRAKRVMENCIPEVIKELDADTFTVNHVYTTFAGTKKTRQASLLTRMLDKRNAEPDAEIKQRLVAAQKTPATAEASKYSFPRDDDRYEVVHIAPDWNTTSLNKIRRLPVSKFILSDAAVFLDCPMRKVPIALQLLDCWKLHPLGFIVVEWENYAGEILDYVSQEPLYVVIGTAKKNAPLESDGDKRLAPHYRADNPHNHVIKILTDYFGGYMRGCMLDMTSTEPIDGWDVLELKFRKNK